MTTKIELQRVFIDTKTKNELADPNTTLSPEEVLDLYVEQYPNLINSKITGPEIKGEKAIYKFESIIGTKG